MLALFDAIGRQTGPAAEVEATHQNAGGAERAPKEVHHLFDSAGQPITLEAYRCEAAGCGELFQYRWALIAHQNRHTAERYARRAATVRKTPRWPRSSANFSLL